MVGWVSGIFNSGIWKPGTPMYLWPSGFEISFSACGSSPFSQAAAPWSLSSPSTFLLPALGWSQSALYKTLLRSLRIQVSWQLVIASCNLGRHSHIVFFFYLERLEMPLKRGSQFFFSLLESCIPRMLCRLDFLGKNQEASFPRPSLNSRKCWFWSFLLLKTTYLPPKGNADSQTALNPPLPAFPSVLFWRTTWAFWSFGGAICLSSKWPGQEIAGE